MRILAMPHFLMGFAFLLTSRAMRRPASWAWLLALAAVGTALCRLFSELGPPLSRLPQLILLFYFGIHAFRDEAHFFVVNGDAPAGAAPRRIAWAVLLAPLLLAGLFLAVDSFLAAFEIGRSRHYTTALFRELPAPLRRPLGLVPLAALAVAVPMLGRRAARMPGGARGFVRAYRPMLVVCAGIALIILAEALIQGRSRALVTLHVTGWYVFVMHQLARRGPPVPVPRPFSWPWMRSTRPGFAFLHIGLAVLTLAGCAVAAYGFRNGSSQPWVLSLLSSNAFPYWTILHITTSFVPK